MTVLGLSGWHGQLSGKSEPTEKQCLNFPNPSGTLCREDLHSKLADHILGEGLSIFVACSHQKNWRTGVGKPRLQTKSNSLSPSFRQRNLRVCRKVERLRGMSSKRAQASQSAYLKTDGIRQTSFVIPELFFSLRGRFSSPSGVLMRTKPDERRCRGLLNYRPKKPSRVFSSLAQSPLYLFPRSPSLLAARSATIKRDENNRNRSGFCSF